MRDPDKGEAHTANHSIRLEDAGGRYCDAGFCDPVAGAETAEGRCHACAHNSKE